MVYIRSKKVKGIDYAYLVKSIWNKRKNTSNQQTIKYLGKASEIKIYEFRKSTIMIQRSLHSFLPIVKTDSKRIHLLQKYVKKFLNC
jgi:hypothetical protein